MKTMNIRIKTHIFIMLLMGAGFADAQTVRTHGLSQMPVQCLKEKEIKEILDYIIKQGGRESYDCTFEDETWTIKAGHLAHVMVLSDAYATGYPNFRQRTAVFAGKPACPSASEAPYWAKLTRPLRDDQNRLYNAILHNCTHEKFRTPDGQDLGFYNLVFGDTVKNGTTSNSSNQHLGKFWEDYANWLTAYHVFNKSCLANVSVAYSCDGLGFREFVHSRLPLVVANNVTARLPNTPPQDQDGNPVNPPDNNGGGGGVTHPEQPTDDESKCSIIDIPCNLRWLFVPRENYMRDKIENVNNSWGGALIPISAVDQISFGFSGLDYVDDLTIDFGYFYKDAPELTNQMLQTIAFFQVFLWVWGYIGLPSIFSRRAGEANGTDRLTPDQSSKSSYSYDSGSKKKSRYGEMNDDS